MAPNSEVLYVNHDAVTLDGRNYNNGDRIDPNSLPPELVDLARKGQLYGVQLGQGNANVVRERNAPPPITMGFNQLGEPIMIHLAGPYEQETHKGNTVHPTEPLHTVVDVGAQPETTVVQRPVTAPPALDLKGSLPEPTQPSEMQRLATQQTTATDEGDDQPVEPRSTEANVFLAGPATDVVANLKKVDDPASLDALSTAEEAGKNRSTVLTAIQTRRDELAAA